MDDDCNRVQFDERIGNDYPPDLSTVCRLDERGLEVTGQRLEPDRAVLACRVVGPDQ